MELFDVFVHKRMRVLEMPKWGGYLRGKWEQRFVNHLTDAEKRGIYLDQFLWHVFSYEKKTCLTDEQVAQAFREERKGSCYVFYQHSDYAMLVENAARMTAEDFADEYDVYVADKQFTWTYVKTHETGWCGPYFCRR